MLRAWLRRLLGLGSVVPFDFCSWCSRTWCCDCDACWSRGSSCCPLLCLACLGLCSVWWIPALVGVSVARPVVGSTGEMCHRWWSPSPVLSSRRPGSTTGLPRFSRLWIRFSSAHFWSLLCWRRLSVVLPASAVDCCLSSLRAGVCSLLWRWRISARVLMVACLPLLRVGGMAPSPVPLMLVASTGFLVNHGLF